MRLLEYAKPAISGFGIEKHRQIGQIGPDESHRSAFRLQTICKRSENDL